MKRFLCSMTLLTAAALMVPAANAAPAPQKSQAEQIVNGPRVEGTGSNWAMIAWTTNTGGSSIVKYGTDRNNLSQTAQAPYANSNKLKTGHEVHRVKLNNLEPGKTYYYQVVSGQGEGTGTGTNSSIEQFTTKASGASAGYNDDNAKHSALQIVDGPRVEGTGKSWAMIAWTTNTGGSSVIKYGTDRNNLSQTAQAPYADKNNLKTGHEVHRVKVSGLRPGTTYYFQVTSGQGEGTGTGAQSQIQSFSTKK